MNEYLVSDKLEGAIKELVEVWLSIPKNDGRLIPLEDGGCVAFGNKEVVADLLVKD